MAVTTGKIARKYMAHFLDSGSLCGGTSGYERLGKDLEEYNVELSSPKKYLRLMLPFVRTSQPVCISPVSGS